MPRGKYLRKNKHNENALITRLMQISLTMDDHIYYSKHITASQAGGFLQEIATLKLQCLPTNVRALQVIEKLTRCMRSIVTGADTEQDGQSFNKCFLIDTEYTRSTSPVYSLPDEDRIIDIDEQNDVDIFNTPDDETVHKQINIAHITHEEVNVVHASKKQDNIIYVPCQTQNNPKKSLGDVEVIDITNDSDTNETNSIVTVSNKQNSAIGHLNSGISKMIIQDRLVGQSKTDDETCSQSILDNYENDNNNKLAGVEKNTVVAETTYYKIDAKAHVANKVNNYFDRTQTAMTAMSTPASTNAPSKLVNSQPTNVNHELVNQGKPTLLVNKNKRRTKKTENGKENASTKGKPKAKSNNVKKNCHHNTIMVTKDVTKGIHKIDKDPTETVKKSKKKPKNKVNKIYNNNVENDLSWVENLRYVREISPDEYDPALNLLQDNFWDNFALPDGWNDSEFDI